MKKLSLVDDTFLRFESRRQPLHIGMLMLFEPPPGAERDFPAKLAERLRQSARAAEPFNQRMVSRGGLHYWEPDDEFDLAHHFVHMALPQPGRIRELLAMVSRVHCGHLDRSYPLWRIYLVEGLEDGRFAVYLKIHHAVVDGVAGIRMLINMMSPDAEVSKHLPPPWEVGTRRSEANPLPVPTRAAGGLSALRSLAREGVRSMAPVWRELSTSLRDYRAGNTDLVIGGQAPRCIFNQQVSGTRRFAAQSYSAPRMKAVAKFYGTTLNDVILAMCGSALRRYLQDLGQLPDKPLVAAVPVSVRRDDSSLGNEVAFTLAHLATHLDDPAARIVAIKSCMDYNKQRIRRLSPAQLVTYASLMLMPGAVNALLGLTPDKALGNIVISHVPGPRQPMYWQGARLTGLYPASLLVDSATLNITIISRQDFVDFGLIACRRSVPHMQRLLEYLEDGLLELEGTIR